MKPAQLSERFYDLVAPDIPNEWDVDEVLEPLMDESDAVCEAILGHIPVIWPVSHSLCFDFLRLLPSTLHQLTLDQIPRWIGITLDRYETDGLHAAQRFMQNDIQHYLQQLQGSGGLNIASVEKKLLPYIRGIAREDLQLLTARQIHTDTSTIFVPQELSVFHDNALNFLLYKLIVTFQWGFIRCGSFVNNGAESLHKGDDQESKNGLWLRTFLDDFDIPQLARDIYHSLESIRVRIFLEHELPGLMRASRKHIFPHFFSSAKDRHPLSPLRHALVTDKLSSHSLVPSPLTAAEAEEYCSNRATARTSLEICARLYPILARMTNSYLPISPYPFQGVLKLRSVENARKLKEQKMGEQFVDMMAAHLLSLSRQELKNIIKDEQLDSAQEGLAESDITMIMDSEFAQTADKDIEAPLLVTINNEEVQIPEELQTFSKEFLEEFGHLPARFLSAAAGKAGREMLEQEVTAQTEREAPPIAIQESLSYDEWDYRRQGYRKNWCTLQLKELNLIRSSFVQKTMKSYHGLSVRLRHQFEMMRSQERFVKRQREGDDIDFDALVESIADSRAGISPSEHLFIRLKRDERDIAVLFLVDMSNSTSGWVNNALKESLLLMTEALEVLGDRYGIYGFSGMRRSRCELYHVKHLTESYSDAVKDRIASIAPSEYTRMGPPLRHAAKLLKDVDAKVRLIITLSDGKPEDYDDYKGEYAIEDTRHALLEAKTADIHPFCITIDHQARDYMKHMYGPANYIFIDDVRKLPLRIPEIYRSITS